MNQNATSPAARGADLIAALPDAAQWPAVIIGVRAYADGLPKSDALKAAAWRLMAATLANEPAVQREALAQARAVAGRNGWWYMGRAADALIDSEDDPQVVVQAVERRLMAAAKDHDSSIQLPDLVSLVGEERALPVIRIVLAMPLSLERMTAKGRKMRALCVREALARLDTLTVPPWGLIKDADSVGLFEALEKKFPLKAGKSERPNRQNKLRAEASYLTQLIATKRINDAVARLSTVNDYSTALIQQLPIDELAEQRPQELCDVVRDLLRKEPERPLWSLYGALAGQLGRAAELKQMLHDHRDAAARQSQLIDLLLAGDDVDGAVAALHIQLEKALHPPAPVAPAAGATAVKGTDSEDDSDTYSLETDSGGNVAVRLLNLGTLLKRQDLVSEAIAAFAALPAQVSNSWSQDDQRRTSLLIANGQAALAERMLVASMALPPKNTWDTSGSANALACLVRLYASAGRPADAVTMLTKADRWGAPDLADVTNGFDSHAGRLPLAVVAGTAFADLGKPDEARRLALLALDQESSCDEAYALLLRIDGAKAAEVFERLRRRDALEERPLIWLAQLQLDAGKPAEAEKLARLAMETDPSDGDQGPGNRMRARQVMAEALEKIGRADEAKVQRTVITAIRAGESADAFLRAGLATRAAEAYRASEAILDKTYCVQSRMAVTLAKLGRDKEAAVHFRRAFELMPKAFGRMESHCFGCEGVFGGGESKRIADEIFTGMVAREPKNPRHQYLLGYLRSQQERPAEAADCFRAALALDPDYYSAASHLLSLDDELRLPRTERERVALALARLDPGNHHNGWNVAQIRDLAALSTILAAHAGDLSVSSRPVLTLMQPPTKPGVSAYSSFSSRGSTHDSAGKMIAQHPLLDVVQNLLDQN